MTIGVFYSKTTGRVRQIVSPYVSDATTNPVNSGEGIIYFNDPNFNGLPDVDAIQAAVSGITGIVPSGDRVAMIENATGFVVSNHFVCANCGDVAYPGHTMTAHPTAVYGWLSLNGVIYDLPGLPQRGRRGTPVRSKPGFSAERNKRANRQQ
jgi:hypothetical protein